MVKQNNKVQTDLEILRNLLSGPDKTKLDRLQQRFDDPKQFAQTISHVLPQAINLSSRQSNKLLKKQ